MSVTPNLILDADYFGEQMAAGYQRLDEPIVVAFSGGGDSLALLHLTLQWAHGQPVHALIVDHNLRAESRDEAECAAAEAARIGAKPQILTWQHEGVQSGIQERARRARYGLMGEACRALGANTLLLGHNEDDQAETVAIRQACGSGWRGLAGIKRKTLAPVWPELRGVHLHRPLLNVSRETLREYCEGHALNYLNDPSNENTAFQRVQIRRELSSDPERRAEMLTLSLENSERLASERIEARRALTTCGNYPSSGEYTIARPKEMPVYGLAVLLRNMGGADRMPDMSRVEALLAHIQVPNFTPRTLGGAIVTFRSGGCVVSRDPGGVLGRRGEGAAWLDLPPNITYVWDNRFAVRTTRLSVKIGPLWLGRDQLEDSQRDHLKAYALPTRKTLPAFYQGDSLVYSPFTTLPDNAVSSEFEVIDLTESRGL